MLAGCLTFLFVFFIGFQIFGKKKKNPYISTHKKKWQNEKDYQDYLKWLDKTNGGDLPLKEIKFKDDVEILKEVNKIINKLF